MAEDPRKRFDIATAAAGPVRAAVAGLWVLFGITAFLELTGLVLIGQSLMFVPEGEDPRGWLAGGLVLFALARLVLGFLMPPLGDAARRQQRQTVKGGWGTGERFGFALALSAFVYALTLWRFVPVEPPAFLAQFPTDSAYGPKVAGWFDAVVSFMTKSWRGFFDVVTVGLRSALNFVELVFVQSPWPVTVVLVLLMAWRLAGPRTTVFAGAALAYVGLLGLWTDSMATLALVAVSVGICVVLGLPAGIALAKSNRLKTIVEPVLDVMQTLPTFVYLIPAVALFSIGKPPGVIATVIFALPSMIRPTELGIRQVPENVREAANAFGANPWQLLWKVELPLATPSIRLGVNQTIMMCLSMVVVAALIGAGGLGQGVMQSLQHLQTGQGFVVGFAIVLIAMVLDRMLRGREEERRRDRT
ncbi:MAG: ABC transporter permease subunit [Hyphomicrobiaceae bacterium]